MSDHPFLMLKILVFNAWNPRWLLILPTLLCLALHPVPALGTVVTYTYDASLGTTPVDQGWTLSTGGGGGSSSVVGGVLNLDTTASNAISHGWRIDTAPFLYTDTVVLEATMRVNSSGFLASPRRAGYYLAVTDDTTYPIWAGLSNSNVHFIYDAENYSTLQSITLNDGSFHDFKMVLDATGFDLFIDNVQVLNEPFSSGTWSLQNEVRFGDFSGSVGSNTDLTFFRATIGTVPEPTSVALLGVAGVVLFFGLAGHRLRV